MSIKKYKLIKEYPNSPKLGSVIIDTSPSNGAKDCWFSENWCKPGVAEFFLPRSTNPENHPEFWELMKKKEWEIVYYKTTHNIGFLIHGMLVNKKNYDKVNKTIEFSKYTEIESVKRLSDNTIFSIGDKVINPKLKSNATFTIIKFELDCDCEHMLALGGGGAIGIHKIEKYKEPILTTEDGVNLFQGDEFWHVDTYFCGGKGVLNNTFKPLKGYKHFSTKKAAKDWIEMNKPQFSKNDLARKGIGFIYVDGQEIWKIDLGKLYNDTKV